MAAVISKSAMTPSFIGRIGDDAPGRTPEHLLRLLSDREHRLAAARVLLHGHHAGLVGDDAHAAGRGPSRGENENGAFFRLGNNQPVALAGDYRRNAPWKIVSGS